jgi:hypothetical protein
MLEAQERGKDERLREQKAGQGRMSRAGTRHWGMAEGDTAEKTQGEAYAAATSDRTKSAAGGKITRRKKKKIASYKQEIKPVIERLLGQRKLMILTGMDEVEDEAQEEELSEVECPAYVQLFINKRGVFARWIMDVASREEAVGVLQGLQWAWDKRKTKPDTEERSIQEAVKLVVDSVNKALMGQIREEEWEEEVKKFGQHVRTVCGMMDALGCGVDEDDYPRIMFETTRLMESLEGEQQQLEAGHRDEGQHHQADREPQLNKGED